MFTCGIPLFLLEVSVGQYLGVGGMSVVGQLCPILKGVGYSAIVMVFLENVYYIIIVAWTMFYIFNTFYSLGSGLPWSSCERGSKYYKKKKYYLLYITVSYSIIYIRSVLFLYHDKYIYLTFAAWCMYFRQQLSPFIYKCAILKLYINLKDTLVDSDPKKTFRT